jgi:transcriptional regulator with XRE-family HTH domain
MSLTLVDVAAKSGLSQPFLSQVETGRARPSLVSLRRIADALDTIPQAFFRGVADQDTAPLLVRANDVRVVDVDGSSPASQCHVLLAGTAPFHLLEFDGLPAEYVEYFQHLGFEAAYVIAGRVEIDIAGDRTVLGPGDSMSYSSNLPHRIRSLGRKRARVLLIETRVTARSDERSAAHADFA